MDDEHQQVRQRAAARRQRVLNAQHDRIQKLGAHLSDDEDNSGRAPAEISEVQRASLESAFSAFTGGRVQEPGSADGEQSDLFSMLGNLAKNFEERAKNPPTLVAPPKDAPTGVHARHLMQKYRKIFVLLCGAAVMLISAIIAPALGATTVDSFRIPPAADKLSEEAANLLLEHVPASFFRAEWLCNNIFNLVEVILQFCIMNPAQRVIPICFMEIGLLIPLVGLLRLFLSFQLILLIIVGYAILNAKTITAFIQQPALLVPLIMPHMGLVTNFLPSLNNYFSDYACYALGNAVFAVLYYGLKKVLRFN